MVVAVVPAKDEEATIANVVKGVRGNVDEVIVVDDGSTDATAALARAEGAVVVSHLINRGQGAALATGTLLALRSGADVIVHFDADSQHDPADIPALLAPVLRGEADVALGSRFLGKAINLPLTRRMVLRVGVLFTRFFSGLRVTDTNNGLRVLSRHAAETIVLTHDGMAHASELLDQIADRGLRYVEVPVTVRYTAHSLARGQRSGNALHIVRRLLIEKFFPH